MPTPIYLDYAATTPVDARVIQCMVAHMSVDGDFGNPASRSHAFGWQAEEAVEAEGLEIVVDTVRELKGLPPVTR